MSKNQQISLWVIPPTWFRAIVAILLILGIFFRFVNLDRKVYWFDETFTSIRISGYKEIEAVKQFANARIINIKDLQKYQQPNPERGILSTIEGLAIEDSQHPPLYYVMARFWAEWFGSSVAVMRSLPALISLLAFPCVYWLCLELFESSLTAWIAVALLAISPFQVLYAQEARQYSLWTVTILLSSAALLRAMRLQTGLSWGIYGLTLIINLYTFLFSIIVTIGQAIYVIVSEELRFSKVVLAYLACSLIGTIVFAPWLWVVITNRSQANSSTSWISGTRFSIPKLIQSWIHNASLSFFDMNLLSLGSGETLAKIISKLAEVSLLALILYAFYFLYRRTPKRIWLFVLTLTVTPSLALILPDIITGGIRSVIPRYGIPSYLASQLAIAYLLSTKLTDLRSKQQQKIWKIILITILSCGVLSCAMISQADAWWSKTVGEIRQVARITNEAKSPLLIGSPTVGDLLSLSHLVDSKVKFLVTPECAICSSDPKATKPTIPPIPENFSEVFLYQSGSFDTWKKELEQNRRYKVDLISVNSQEIPLFKVRK